MWRAILSLILLLSASPALAQQVQKQFGTLGQSNPAASTLTAIYTVPKDTQTEATALMVCNRDTAAHNIRISIAVNGAADTVAQYVYYNFAVPANASLSLLNGVILFTGDVVRVWADAQQVSFTLQGYAYSPGQ